MSAMNAEIKKTAAEEGARADLQSGESLLHCDIGKAQISAYGRLVMGLLLVVLAIWSFAMGFSESEYSVTLSLWQGFIICIFLVILGGSFIYSGLKNSVLSAGSYFFVTSQRLCLMQKNISGKLNKTDIPLTSVTKIDAMTFSSGIWRGGRSSGLRRADTFVELITSEKKRITFSTRDPELMRAFVLSAIDEMKGSNSGG